IKPFNFEALFEALENSLDYETYHQYKSLYLEMHKARWSAKKLYDYLNQNEFSNQEINYLNKQLHYIYLEIQECFVRLSWNGSSIFPHEAHQENIFQLREAIRLLKNQKVPEAIIELCKIDLNLFNYY
ncbi:histidine kinase, partial [Acinetobacter baumannii]